MRSASRRGFTLIELTLALLVGSLVIGACLSAFLLMDRGDRTMQERYQTRIDLSDARLAIANSFRSISLPRGRLGEDSESENRRFESPRLVLDADPRNQSVQRFEVTLSRPPLPGLAVTRINPRTGRPLNGPIRGVWEVVPQRVVVEGEQRVSWSLQWRTISIGGVLVQPPAGALPGSEQDDTRRVMVRGLRSLEWTAFKESERQPRYMARNVTDLPSFVEIELTAETGQYANWLFEVDWTLADEEPGRPTELDGVLAAYRERAAARERAPSDDSADEADEEAES